MVDFSEVILFDNWLFQVCELNAMMSFCVSLIFWLFIRSLSVQYFFFSKLKKNPQIFSMIDNLFPWNESDILWTYPC